VSARARRCGGGLGHRLPPEGGHLLSWPWALRHAHGPSRGPRARPKHALCGERGGWGPARPGVEAAGRARSTMARPPASVPPRFRRSPTTAPPPPHTPQRPPPLLRVATLSACPASSRRRWRSRSCPAPTDSPSATAACEPRGRAGEGAPRGCTGPLAPRARRRRRGRRPLVRRSSRRPRPAARPRRAARPAQLRRVAALLHVRHAARRRPVLRREGHLDHLRDAQLGLPRRHAVARQRVPRHARVHAGGRPVPGRGGAAAAAGALPISRGGKPSRGRARRAGAAAAAVALEACATGGPRPAAGGPRRAGTPRGPARRGAPIRPRRRAPRPTPRARPPRPRPFPNTHPRNPSPLCQHNRKPQRPPRAWPFLRWRFRCLTSARAPSSPAPRPPS
jgi:hypothetical protein